VDSKKNDRQKSTFWSGVILLVVCIPFCFWIRFGRIDGFSIALTGFLVFILIAIEFIPTLNIKFGKEQEAIKVARGPLDWLGVVWLLSIPFAPFLMWLFSSATIVTLENWKTLLSIRTLICVAIPSLSGLPLLKYVRGKASPYSLFILVIGTGFPISFGWNSMRDFTQGPIQEYALVVDVVRVHTSLTHHIISANIIEVKLSDGRIFEANSAQVNILRGSFAITFLEHTGVILSAR